MRTQTSNRSASRFTGRVVVVTGAAAVIGSAVVARILAEGGRVAGLDIDGRPRVECCDYVHLECDVTDRAAVESAVSAVHERFGRIDGLVNSAGVGPAFDVVELTDAEWDPVIARGLTSAWLCAQATIPHLRRGRAGAIVNITSTHSQPATVGSFPYAAATAGLEGLTRGLALELAPDDIRVNAVAPGRTRSRLVQEWLDRQPAPAAAERSLSRYSPSRIAHPAEIALVVAFALSSDARAMTGAVLPVDCGQRLRLTVM